MPRAFSPEESDRIRNRLMEVGRRLLATTGFRKTTVDAIARGAGVSKGGFYLFFPKKEALWQEILRAAEQELRARLHTVADNPELEPEACLRLVLEVVFEAVTQHPMLRALADPDDMAWLMRSLPEETFVEARKDDVIFFRGLSQKLRERGAIRSDVPDHLFVMLPAAALALAQGRHVIGEEHFARFVTFEIEAWTARLRMEATSSND